MNQTTPAELAERLAARDNLFLLDVREPHEVQEVAIAGIHNIPLGELNERQAEIPSDMTVVTICRSGGRSSQAAAHLQKQGWEVINLDGGMLAWEDSSQYCVSATA